MSQSSAEKKYIRLDAVAAPDPRTLVYRFTSTVPFLKRSEFFVQYNQPLDFNEPLASVVFAAVMAPIAQASGAELLVPRLDEDFAHSLGTISGFWSKSYGWSPLKLRTEPVKSVRKNAGCGMLFSGGLDSMATYIQHRDKKPRLFTVLGADVPHTETAFIERLKRDFYDPFAKQENVSLTYITTDIRAVLDEKALSESFKVDWYGGIYSGLFMTSLVAPVAGLEEYLCSSCSLEHPPCVCAGNPQVLDHTVFAGTRVQLTQSDTSRVQKIKKYLVPNPQFHRFIRVCWKQFEKLNCSRCNKCLRTICELLVNNVDPDGVNFETTDATLPELKTRMTNSFCHFFYSGTELGFFREIQDSVRLDALKDLHGSRAFFEWFKSYSELRRVRPSWYRRGRYLMESVRGKLVRQQYR